MFLRTWIKGWRDKAVVVEDGISAGSQDEGMTRHHSSSPRGPRPRPSNTPPRQSSSDTLTHQLCRPPEEPGFLRETFRSLQDDYYARFARFVEIVAGEE